MRSIIGRVSYIQIKRFRKISETSAKHLRSRSTGCLAMSTLRNESVL
jgi:hypothetical protein